LAKISVGVLFTPSRAEREVLVHGALASAVRGRSIAAQRKVEPGFAAVRQHHTAFDCSDSSGRSPGT